MIHLLHLHLQVLLSVSGPMAGDSIYGCLRESLNQSALQGVRVEVDGGGPGYRTDDEGRYSLPAPAAGARRLRFTRTGYRPLSVDITVSPGSSLHLDIDLDPSPTRLAGIAVSAPARGLRASGETRASALDGFVVRLYDGDSLRQDPISAGGDLLLAATGAPGGEAQAGFPTSIRLRGGASDQTQLLIDGVPVYGAMHLGGASSLLNPDAIDRVEVQSAVPSANVTGRLSGIIDVRLRPDTAQSLALAGAWTPVWVRQTVEAPLARGRASLLVSGQRSYRGLFVQDHVVEQEANGFDDLLLRGSLAAGRDHLALYLLRSRDHLGFPSVAERFDDARDGASGRVIQNRFDWSSNTEALVWRHPVGDGAGVTGRVWHAGSGAHVGWEALDGQELLTNRLDETGARLEMLRTDASSHALVGLEIRRPVVAYEVTGPARDLSASAAAPLLRLRSAPTIVGVFAEGERALGRRWTARVGVRADHLGGVGISVEPRVAVAYRIGPSLTAFAGYGRLHQYMQSGRNEESPLDYAFGADLFVATQPGGLPPARSDELSGALVTELGDATTFRIDGYFRAFTGIAVAPAGTAGPFADRVLPVGSGEARGLEVELTHHARRIDLRATAGVGATERQTAGGEYSPRYQRSNWLRLGAAFRVGSATFLRLGTSTSAGAPTSTLADELEWQQPGDLAQGGEISGSPQAIQGSLNANRLPPYFRLDLGLERTWLVRLAGAAGRLTTSLVVTNLLNRRNALALIATPNSAFRRTIDYPSRSVGLQLAWQF